LHCVYAVEAKQIHSWNKFAFNSFACKVLINFIWEGALPRPQKYTTHVALQKLQQGKGAASTPKSAHNSIRL